MRRVIFKINIWLIILSLMIVGIVAVQPVYATGVGEVEVQNLYKNQGYRYFPKLPNVSVDKFFTVSFSEPIKYDTINNNNIELIEKQTGEDTSLVFEKIDDEKVRVIPQQSLIKGKSYYLIIHNRIKTM